MSLNLGQGPWKEKRKRLDKFIGSLCENEKEAKEFRLRTIKPRTRQQSTTDLLTCLSPPQNARKLVQVNKERQENARVAREKTFILKRNQIIYS